MSKYIELDTAITSAISAVHDQVTAVDIVTALEEAPTADVVEVVRCRDCKWCDVENWGGEILYGCDCSAGLNDVEPDGFCSYGERKNDT